jgi:hypothetical protein
VQFVEQFSTARISQCFEHLIHDVFGKMQLKGCMSSRALPFLTEIDSPLDAPRIEFIQALDFAKKRWVGQSDPVAFKNYITKTLCKGCYYGHG